MTSNKSNPVTTINILDKFNPETCAMLQAFYSRSTKPIMERLEEFGETDEENIKAKLKTWYIGYGHSSVAEGGSTTIFIEGVSHFVAKAIQDNPLYSGQESSTRYIDYKHQPYVNPFIHDYNETKITDIIILEWYAIYNEYLPLVIEGLQRNHPREQNEDEKTWDKAIKARAFDIMRGFLPAASCTQLSWHTNLRQARDKLRILLHHPLREVNFVATEILKQLLAKYPNSFKSQDCEIDEWLMRNAQDIFYLNGVYSDRTFGKSTDLQVTDRLNVEGLDKLRRMLLTRPATQRLPQYLQSLGDITCSFYLDFASWRDLQRHRNGVCPTPHLIYNSTFTINDWYMDQVRNLLGNKDSIVFQQRVDKQLDKVSELNYDTNNLQYLMPLGTNCVTSITYSLPQLVYVLELRTSQHVHPTLRKAMQDIALYVKDNYPQVKLYVDMEKDTWSIKRGEQDILKKN